MNVCLYGTSLAASSTAVLCECRSRQRECNKEEKNADAISKINVSVKKFVY